LNTLIAQQGLPAAGFVGEPGTADIAARNTQVVTVKQNAEVIDIENGWGRGAHQGGAVARTVHRIPEPCGKRRWLRPGCFVWHVLTEGFLLLGPAARTAPVLLSGERRAGDLSDSGKAVIVRLCVTITSRIKLNVSGMKIFAPVMAVLMNPALRAYSSAPVCLLAAGN